MKKKKVVYRGVGYCPKDGNLACCVKQGDCSESSGQFDEVDSAVQRVWQAFSELEPSVKDIKKYFAQQLLISYLFQCTRIGLTEHETKMLVGKDLKRYYERINDFRNIAKLHIEKD